MLQYGIICKLQCVIFKAKKQNVVVGQQRLNKFWDMLQFLKIKLVYDFRNFRILSEIIQGISLKPADCRIVPQNEYQEWCRWTNKNSNIKKEEMMGVPTIGKKCNVFKTEFFLCHKLDSLASSYPDVMYAVGDLGCRFGSVLDHLNDDILTRSTGMLNLCVKSLALYVQTGGMGARCKTSEYSLLERIKQNWGSQIIVQSFVNKKLAKCLACKKKAKKQ